MSTTIEEAYAEGRKAGLLEAAEIVPRHLRNIRALIRLQATMIKREMPKPEASHD